MIGNLRVAILALVVWWSGSAVAVPITFGFDMPAFTDASGSTGLLGETSTLTLLVDNGNNSVIDQSYLNAEIFGATVTIGSQTFSWMPGEPNFQRTVGGVSGPVEFITTDSNGVPTLNLSSGPTAAVSFVNPPTPGTFQSLQIGTGGSPPYIFTSSLGTNVGFRSRGPFVGTQVPEPAMLSLLGIGAIAGLLIRRRNKLRAAVYRA